MRTDQDIKRDIVDELYWDARVDASRVLVEVADGTVMLRGEVPTYASRFAAEADARMIRGAAVVENQIEVDRPGVVPDDELRSSILLVLAWAADVDSSNIDVVVQEGVVTLEGTVARYSEKIRAEELANGITGVIAVYNRLAVVPSRKTSDQVIAEEVVRALRRRLQDQAEAIDVQVESGLVTLTGAVTDWPSYHAAQDAAQFTSGVRAIDNELILELNGSRRAVVEAP